MNVWNISIFRKMKLCCNGKWNHGIHCKGTEAVNWKFNHKEQKFPSYNKGPANFDISMWKLRRPFPLSNWKFYTVEEKVGFHSVQRYTDMIYIKSEKITNPKDLTMLMQFRILLGKSWELCEDIVKVVHTPDHQQDWRNYAFSLSQYILFKQGMGEKIYMKVKLISMYATFWT